MKALTICQPYASLIAIGEKRCENRMWPTNIRGRIAIHAGKSREWLRSYPYKTPDQMPFGAVVATAELIDCVELSKVTPESRFGWLLGHMHAEGPFCFVLEHVQMLAEPIPFRGAQGFFFIPDHLMAPQTVM